MFLDPILLTSSAKGNIHFGTALGQIGDIDKDGFNDLAISAPFEGNGAIYIYYGNAQGISQKPSQKIEAPSNIAQSMDKRSAMFGFSISRGVDTDDNGFDDFAVGSPNSEQVFLYKSYPVVEIVARLSSSVTPLPFDNSSFVLDVCGKINSNWTKFDKEISKLLKIF